MSHAQFGLVLAVHVAIDIVALGIAIVAIARVVMRR